MKSSPSLKIPTRVCISGEDLDWIGGKTVCAGIDLYTKVSLAGPPGKTVNGGMDTNAMYSLLRQRHPELPQVAPPATIICSAPSPGGLGTSTSIAIGYYSALDKIGWTMGEDPVELAYSYEYSFTHGGGVDHLAISMGGWILTEGQDGRLPTVIASSYLPQNWGAIIVYSGVAKDQRNTFSNVRQLLAADSHAFDTYINQTSQVSVLAWRAIVSSDLPLMGECLGEAHAIMRDVRQMSNERLESLRVLAESATGLRFKLTGSGGGGCLFAIATKDQLGPVRDQLVAAGVANSSIYEARITKEALR